MTISCVTFSMVLLAAIMTPTAFAKRSAPRPVAPVVTNGVRYTAPNDRGRVCYIQASDVVTGSLKWERIIYEVAIDPKMEEDIQWDFITNLAVQDRSLIVRTESSQTYVLDVKTKRVTKRPKPVQPAGIHIVQPGESLSAIALTHGFAVNELAERNGIANPDKIRVGQKLIIPEHENGPNKSWTEKCPSCGKSTFLYAYTFDADDYAVLSVILKVRAHNGAYLQARAPHGPTPACDSRFSTNDLPYLSKKIPQLQYETYASFLERNNRIAVHRIKTLTCADGSTVRISEGKEDGNSLGRFSRAGFNYDKTQVLLFTGQIFFLYEKNGNELKEIGRCAMWIP